MKGAATKAKIHYKGQKVDEDFIIFVDDVETYKKWLSDKSIPVPHFISSYKIFITHKQGAQGIADAPNNSTLDNEFGTHNEDDVVQKILADGSLQESEFPEHQGPKNDAKFGNLAPGR
ncbi:shwachman-Bodian-diamond syndrome protein [Xylariomycetidae sp. FL2044]|nr:shwachman-Bodian-diamond syndrome protein [Xylariomycetidae sp. FL2044]